MIPISPDQKKEWKDPESGIIYQFRYLVGEYQNDIMSLFDTTEKMIKNYTEKARREINSETKGKKPSKQKMDELIKERSEQLAQKEIVENPNINIDYARKMVDTFLCGWKGKNLPPFPSEKPSMYFHITNLSKLVDVINGFFQELMGITIDESKN